MQATVSWKNDLSFEGVSENGHTIMMDGNKGAAASSPMEMVLMAAGGCSSVDVVSILQKTRQEIVNVSVDLKAERVDAVPAVFKSIHLHFIIEGNNVDEKHVSRAVSLSADKYCSVSIMLGASVDVTHSFEIKAVA